MCPLLQLDSCYVLELSFLYGQCVGGNATALPTADRLSKSLRRLSALLWRLRVASRCPWLARKASRTVRIGARKHANALVTAKRRNNVRYSGQCLMSQQPGTTLYRCWYIAAILQVSQFLSSSYQQHQNSLLLPSDFGLFPCCWPHFFSSVFPLLLLAAAS